ncbi:MAG TPA: mandelate racemase/muconate lactonizing enzyme family protein [Armatimonadota bacterium]|nr:mandelate racemase/muconate lactonizing enzyme family protein [Armatimonadota bacterium]
MTTDVRAITEVSAQHYRVPLAEPLFDARHGEHTHFELIIAKVRCIDGALGVGYTYTGGRGGRAIHQVITHDLAPALVGRPASEIAELWEFMNWHIHYVGRGGIAGFAVSAVDIALWDLMARRAEQPLWELLGGEGKPVRTYAGLIDLHYPLDRHLDAISGELDRGHTGIKIKIGRDTIAEDMARARAVRGLIGPETEFMVDANMKWDAQTAIEASNALAEVDPLWLEEPVPPDDFEAFAEVGQACPIPLAMGENLHTLPEFGLAFDTGALAYPQPDASNVGGITGWMQVARMAEERGLPASSHGMQELHVSLLSAVPNGGYMEMHSFAIDQYTHRPLTVHDGMVTPPEAPGIGVEFDWEKLAPHRELWSPV